MTRKKTLILILKLIALTTGIFLATIYHYSGQSFPALLKTIASEMFMLGAAFIASVQVFGHPIITYFYVILFATLILYLVVTQGQRGLRDIMAVKAAAVSVFVLFTALQATNYYHFFLWEFTLYNHLRTPDKYALIHPETYLVARQFRAALPGRHKAIFITDIDTTKYSGMTHHRVLGYHLYPIDIRETFPGEPDAVVAFAKRNARNHIPPGFRVISVFNNENVLAVREEPDD